MAENYKAYLQVQGVNIYASVYDTSQLSIVRGSSLLLKWAVELLDGSHIGKTVEISRAEFELPPPELIQPLQAITTGASSGIYAIDIGQLDGIDTNALKALEQHLEGIAKKIAGFLSLHAYFRYFTFTVVWAIDQNDNFAHVKERLLGKARRQQLRQISLAPQPLAGSEKNTHKPCALEGIIPADSIMQFPPKGDYSSKLISPACQQRFLLGRHLRHGLYRAEVHALIDPQEVGPMLECPCDPAEFAATDYTEFFHKLRKVGKFKDWVNRLLNQLDTHETAESFDEIADGEVFGNLENKIAVFYADGNGFSGIQAELVKTPADQKEFDDKVKTYRREFLAFLLEQWMPNGAKGILRLETLLWGGDEMLFVVPASQGFALVQLFYAQSRKWNVGTEGQKRYLTHAGGLVFCHYKTPIKQAKDLAQDLAERVKEQKYGR